MKKIKVEIEGVTPLLMHSVANMEQQKVKKNPTHEYDNKKDAESVAYRTKNGEFYVPSRCIKMCFVNASSWYKFGKKGAKPIVAGCSRIEPYEILLTDKKGKEEPFVPFGSASQIKKDLDKQYHNQPLCNYLIYGKVDKYKKHYLIKSYHSIIIIKEIIKEEYNISKLESEFLKG